MYEIIYQEIQSKREYEERIKKVLSQCYKEEGLEEAKLTITITLATREIYPKHQSKI